MDERDRRLQAFIRQQDETYRHRKYECPECGQSLTIDGTGQCFSRGREVMSCCGCHKPVPADWRERHEAFRTLVGGEADRPRHISAVLGDVLDQYQPRAEAA